MEVQISTAKFWELADQLRAIRKELDGYQRQIRSSPAIARAIGRELTKAEADYGALVSQYQRLRVLVGLDVAPGLSAVAVGTVIWIGASAAAAMTALVLGIPVLLEYMRTVLAPRARAAEQETATRAGLHEQANQKAQEKQRALQRGDIEGARALAAEESKLRDQAGAPGNGAAPGAPGWLEQNWGWVALAAGGVFLAPRLIAAITR